MTDAEPGIRAFDYLRALKARESEFRTAIERVLRSGQLILGIEGREFEREFADWIGAEHAIGVGSGTDALILALLALGIGPGDEVITVANSAVPTASAIRAIEAIPRFVDVREDSLQIEPQSLERAITPRTRAVIPVHLHGAAADMPNVMRITRAAGVPVVEDCAHAHGTRVNGRHVGLDGHIGCFSFYPTKTLGAFGDGGLCVTNNPDLADRLRSLRMYGFDEHRVAQCDGRNSRLDEIQAAILRVKLRYLDESLRRRREIADRYIRGLSDLAAESPLFRLPRVVSGLEHGWHQFVIRTSRRDELIRVLSDASIGSGIHYDTPLHRMPAFRRFHPGDQPLPVAERAAGEILSLPMYPELEDREVDTVIRVIRTWLAEKHAEQHRTDRHGTESSAGSFGTS